MRSDRTLDLSVRSLNVIIRQSRQEEGGAARRRREGAPTVAVGMADRSGGDGLRPSPQVARPRIRGGGGRELGEDAAAWRRRGGRRVVGSTAAKSSFHSAVNGGRMENAI